ncbi:MAG TPA: NUDIX hydrolase [Ktedonobacteraceae bacterium]|nr:NUDIX hydrolase [Ktedonobacteraceae bacterium]
MFSNLPQETRDELQELARSYGQPVAHTAELVPGALADPLNSTDRYGEVCMVVRRPSGKLLTMTKTFYPRGVYRLPTGGINHGERILDALLRETYEETGLQVEVRRFLAAIAYREAQADMPRFYTFAFLLDEMGGTLGATDLHERIEDYREIEPADLLTMARQLDSLGAVYSTELRGNLDAWGRFRAVVHRLVGEALLGKTPAYWQ